MDINKELRSEILEYSLNLEDGVNSLILLCLGIFDDKNATRLFGNKASISFKNKIDLLYGIGVISKEENADIELLMVIRNKFLHDLNCSTFLILLDQVDNGIKNKFQRHIPSGGNINSEESCKIACFNLFGHNIRILLNKVRERRMKFERKHEVLKSKNELIIFQYDLFFDFMSDLLVIVEESALENTEAQNLGNLILEKCQEYTSRISDQEMPEMKPLSQMDKEDIKSYFDINRSHPDLFDLDS